MRPAIELHSQLEVPVVNWDRDTAWERFTGFRKLTVDQFCEIQEQLLTEQLRTIGASRIGMRLLRLQKPGSVEEFRNSVPITNYGDYNRFLDPDAKEELPAFEYMWAHTTGAQARYKYVPYTRRAYMRMLDNLMGAFLLSTAREEGDVRIEPGSSIMYNVPPRPYLSGYAAFGMEQRFGLKGVLKPSTAEHMEFKTKVRTNFETALGKKVDLIISMTSVLVSAGEQFADSLAGRSTRKRPTKRDLSWKAKTKLGLAFIKGAFSGRKPRAGDIFDAKGIIGWGVDTPIFRDQVEKHWGMKPDEIYACTEGGVMGMAGLNSQGMVFNPYMNFVEFLPSEEAAKLDADSTYEAKTHLLSEVKPDTDYEVIISSFYGMPFIRYRLGHHIVFTTVDGNQLPEFEFIGRSDDRLDIAGFTRIDEKTMWEAIQATELPIGSWTARTERVNERPVLHLYVETKEPLDDELVAQQIHEALRERDEFYRDLEDMLQIRPLEVTTLPFGTWDRYYDNRLKKGLELHYLVPPRMNSSEKDVNELVSTAS